jgi:TctA family transporter
MLDELLYLLLGTLYGFFIGVVPVAGATTGLITVFALSDHFLANPYLGIIFLTSLIAASSTGDSFSSILTGVPGSNTTASTVFDGYPMALRGEAARAISAALLTSTFNGVFWGLLAFGLLPFYRQVILYLGVPEFAAFTILSLCCVAFITRKNPVLSLPSIGIGALLGLVGLDAGTGVPRLTGGWDYLNAGIQILPIVAGLFGIPEIVDGWKGRNQKHALILDYWSQVRQGFRDVWINRKLALQGGAIGFFTGMLPGVGGSIGDLLAYTWTTSKHPKEQIEFGTGNVKGVIGPEGANNSQKASSLIPAILFGVPGAPFAAVMMAICMTFGMELGSPTVLRDDKFLWVLAWSFVASTILVLPLSLFSVQYVVKLLLLPYWIFATGLFAIIVWSCMQYTGGWEDFAILLFCSGLGIFCKKYDLNRPALLISFILIERIESYIGQTLSLYQPVELATRPIFMVLMLVSLSIVWWRISEHWRETCKRSY